MLVSTALSSRNTSRSGAMPPNPGRIAVPAHPRMRDLGALLFSGPDAALLSRPVQPAQPLVFIPSGMPDGTFGKPRPPDGPGIHPHPGLLSQAIVARLQAQVIVRRQQAP